MAINSVGEIKRSQRSWALEQGLFVDEKGYCRRAAENLPWLSDEIQSDFLSGDGDEFGTNGGRAKISALHSSSALAVNFFGYWCRRPPAPLSRTLGVSGDITSIRFEQKFPTGVGPRQPNLDVLIVERDGGITAVESKFAEPFRAAPSGDIQKRYIPEAHRLWHEAGLPCAEDIAREFRPGEYAFLDVPQLLKHMLGLALHGTTWRLLLAWYAPATPESDLMRAEIARFTERLGADGRHFLAVSYQALWRDLEPRLSSEDDRYREYMAARYFSRVAHRPAG